MKKVGKQKIAFCDASVCLVRFSPAYDANVTPSLGLVSKLDLLVELNTVRGRQEPSASFSLASFCF